jgi:hypothetical protein
MEEDADRLPARPYFPLPIQAEIDNLAKDYRFLRDYERRMGMEGWKGDPADLAFASFLAERRWRLISNLSPELRCWADPIHILWKEDAIVNQRIRQAGRGAESDASGAETRPDGRRPTDAAGPAQGGATDAAGVPKRSGLLASLVGKLAGLFGAKKRKDEAPSPERLCRLTEPLERPSGALRPPADPFDDEVRTRRLARDAELDADAARETKRARDARESLGRPAVGRGGLVLRAGGHAMGGPPTAPGESPDPRPSPGGPARQDPGGRQDVGRPRRPVAARHPDGPSRTGLPARPESASRPGRTQRQGGTSRPDGTGHPGGIPRPDGTGAGHTADDPRPNDPRRPDGIPNPIGAGQPADVPMPGDPRRPGRSPNPVAAERPDGPARPKGPGPEGGGNGRMRP